MNPLLKIYYTQIVMRTHLSFFLSLVLLAGVIVGIQGCSNDEPISDNTYVNNWILKNMKTYYYWNTELPTRTNKSLNPDDYFESLLSNKDRFSWIQPNFQELLDALGGITKEAGYEFVLYLEAEGSSNVIGQIVYIKPNSPASTAGMVRGNVFTEINGQQLTISNFRTLLGQTSENHTLKYFTEYQGPGNTGTSTVVALNTVVYAENPHFLTTVLEEGDAKIGYYVMNFFARGPENSFDQQMDNIIANFVAEGITDLVLDFRFNGGGSELSTVNLASLIGKDVNETKLFSKREYNTLVTDAILNDPTLGQSFLNLHFSNKATKLNLNRVFVLTSGRTASASELIINGLKPYMEVFLIGTTTVGKNVGSISIYEKNDPRNLWGMQPIVVKLLNSAGQADYDNGFVPNVEVRDNSINLKPLGDREEPMLAEAIRQITGVDPGAAERASSARFRSEAFGSSLDFKKRNRSLYMDGLQEKLDVLGPKNPFMIELQ
jgi:carboxyl-terminal processing protease